MLPPPPTPTTTVPVGDRSRQFHKHVVWKRRWSGATMLPHHGHIYRVVRNEGGGATWRFAHPNSLPLSTQISKPTLQHTRTSIASSLPRSLGAAPGLLSFQRHSYMATPNGAVNLHTKKLARRIRQPNTFGAHTLYSSPCPQTLKSRTSSSALIIRDLDPLRPHIGHTANQP